MSTGNNSRFVLMLGAAHVAGWLILVASMGCQQLPVSWHNPFAAEVPAYKHAYGPTPRQQMENMRQLASRAGELTAQQREQAIKELSSTLVEDPDPMLRQTAVKALADFQGPDVELVLQRSLHDPAADVRMAACEVFGMSGRQATAESVANKVLLLRERVLSDDDPEVRRAAVAALASMRTCDSLQSVADVLADQDPAMQVVAINALKKVTGQEFGDDARAWSDYVKNLPRSRPLDIPGRSDIDTSEVQLATAIGE